MAIPILKRLAQMLVVLIGVSIFIFVLTRVLPGDPIAAALGERASEDQIERLRAQMGLDQSLVMQYFDFVGGLFEGRMGMSLVERRDVAEIIAERLPATLELVLFSLFLAVILGVPLGVVSAVHRDGPIDYASRVVALVGVSIPNFWIGIMLQLFLGLTLSLLPITGRLDGPPPMQITGLYLFDSLVTGNFAAFRDALAHIMAPAIVLASGPLATITRMIRANMIDERAKPYSELAEALGMHPLLINYKYVLRNAFSSTLTVIGFLVPILIGANFVVEKVFSWPGIARFGADAIIASDFNGVVGVSMVVCSFVVVVNVIVELLYRVLDPRIRLGETR
ncbi:ABC transporter permease [Salipiger mucosus]|uniref:Dipeptide transport system permease protein DppB n=1 Tax=Salipiger mucosus DSM 16094 TaxID=1123237 RepID=S9QL74_9RHOB|nr:ABC transporter permease [Salipiger mucosus]EPX80358.1 Dipeptide transport system permease protein DppB [Salipiger mucosus DSM 16094]